ncbi:MAG: sensor domain-containing diguanylate cyclase [Pyrinomonadaceae bacterium]
MSPPSALSGLRRSALLGLLSGSALFISLIALAGWMSGIVALYRMVGGLPAMAPNTAIVLCASSIALCLLSFMREKNIARVAAVALLLIAFGITLATLGQYLFWIDIGLDELIFLFPDRSLAFPGRMSPHAAVGILCVSVALIFAARKRFLSASEILALAGLSATFAAILGHFYGAELLYGVTKYNLMAPQTASVLGLLGFGALLANPESRVIELLSSRTMGGRAARRLLPAAVLVPTILGWVRLFGQSEGYYDTGFGVAMTISFSVVLMCIFVFYFGRMVHHAELKSRAEKEKAEGRERRYRLLVDHGQGLISTHDLEGKITSLNPSGCALLGLREEQVVGRSFVEMMPPEFAGEFSAYLRKIENEGIADGLFSLRSVKGALFTLQYHNILVFEDGHEPYVLGHAQDVTQLLEAQRRLKDLSDRDELTGLYNRRGFLAMARQLIKLENHSGTARGLSLLFADMDGLKAINDTHGHEAGSTAIAEVARILKSAVRDADIVARWGGDEFVILSIGCDGERSELVLERMQRLIREHNTKTPEPFRLGVSIGVAEHQLGGEMSIEKVIAEADQAMYEEKKRRKAGTAVGESVAAVV